MCFMNAISRRRGRRKRDGSHLVYMFQFCRLYFGLLFQTNRVFPHIASESEGSGLYNRVLSLCAYQKAKLCDGYEFWG